MKLSGIFWTIVVIGILFFAFTLGVWWFAGAYVLWSIVGLIIYSNLDYGFFSGGYSKEEFDFDEMWEGFLETPYLYLLPHLLVIGIFVGFLRGTYLLVTNISGYFSNINDKIDNIDFKPKPKKESFKQFKNNFKTDKI